MTETLVQAPDAAAFAPFGRFLAPSIDGRRADHRGLVHSMRPGATVTLAMLKADDLRSRARVPVTRLERHAYSTQTFFPTDVERYLVVVCGAACDGAPDPSTLQAFVVPGDVATHYHAGTWHLGIGCLAGAGLFGMLVHEDGTPEDCEFHDIPETTVVLAEPAPRPTTR